MGEAYRYDEDEAVKFIRRTLSPEVNEKYSNDEILLIIDTIWDYYESQGLTSLDTEITDDEAVDADKLTAYVKKEIKNGKELIMDSSDIEDIVKGELAYEESLEDFI